MITITEQPPSIASILTEPKAPPVPVSECWRWCLQPDAIDAIDTPGSNALVTVTFPAVPTIPADGTTFRIWGYDFTIDSGQAYTSTSFEVTAVGLFTALNFLKMIQSNFFFNRAVQLGFAVVGFDYQVTIIWNDCREQPRFVSEQMVFTGLVSAGATAGFLNGVSPIYVEGYKVVTRAGYYQDANTAFFPISRHTGLDPDKQCTAVGEICIDYKLDIETQLYTELPALTTTSFVTAIQLGRSLMKLFALEYGWVYRENCQAKSGTLKESPLVLGINAAFDIDDPYQMRRYWRAHPDGFPPGQFVVDFLTTQPKEITICRDSFAWLWFLNNWQDEFGQYRLRARFVIYKKGVPGVFAVYLPIINDPTTDASAWHQPINFNVSPQLVIDNSSEPITWEELDYYDVYVEAIEMLTTDQLFGATETIRYRPEHCCEENTDVYFLTPAGGIGTVVVTVNQREVVQEGQEINLYGDCGDSRANRAKYGGRAMVNLRSYEKISFSIKSPRNSEWERWLKHFKASPQHWIKVTDEGGNPLAKKMLLDMGSATTYKNGEGAEFKAVGYLADIPTQKGIEP